MISRRSFFASGMAGLAAGALSSCQSGDQEPPPEVVSILTKPLQDVEVMFAAMAGAEPDSG